MSTKANFDSGEYGPVVVTSGPHEGKVGFYDDDDIDGAIVYLGKWDDGPTIIPLENLRPASTKESQDHSKKVKGCFLESVFLDSKYEN